MPGKHRLYMHCPGLSEDQLYVYLQQFGRITDVYLPKNLDSTSKGYGFASFESADGLTAALAAGDEHNIGGKVVRVNRAGPRPAPQFAGTSDSGRLHAQASSVPLPGGISRQQGGHAVPDRPAHNSSVTPGQTSDQAGSSDGGPSRTGVLQGAGPRIYVGGIPNTVSETMVRNCFSNWGKVEDVYFPKERASGRRRPFCFVTFASQKAAEKAVAQSNREISGYQVASISMTADRIAHYQQVTGGQQDQPHTDESDQPAHPPVDCFQGVMPRMNTSLPLSGRDGLLLGHQHGLSSLATEHVPCPTGLGGQMHYTMEDLSNLHPALFGYLPPGQAGVQPALQQPLLPLSQQMMLSTAQQHATVPSSLHDAFLSSMASTDFTNPALLIPSFNIPQQRAFGHPTQLQAFPLQPHHGLLPPAGGAAALMGQARPPFGRFPYSGTLPMGVPSHAPLPREGSNSGRTSQQQSLNKGQLGSVPGQDQQTAAGMQDAMLQAFDPTVRRPGQNFSEASSVLEDPLMRPYLLLQIPAAQDVYEPKRPLPNFCAVCHAPY